MTRIHLPFVGLSHVAAITLCLMLAGCGWSGAGGSNVTIEAMLDRWEAGNKDAAFDALLSMDWSDPPLAEDSLLKVSNTELAERGDLSEAAELAQQAQREYFTHWHALGRHALDELDRARSAGEDERAAEIEASLDAMVAFLQKSEHLGIFQRLGPALEPLAPGEIQLPAGF